MADTTERLNKILAQQGIASRRASDELIAQGYVKVNGVTAHVGQRVSPSDTITVHDKPILRQDKAKIVLLFNKPRGVTTTTKDPFAKVTVMDYLPPKYKHLFPVGRLDRASRGLLLLTNDGERALRLQHPRFEHEKEY